MVKESFIFDYIQAAISHDDWHKSMGTPANWKQGDDFVKIRIDTVVRNDGEDDDTKTNNE